MFISLTTVIWNSVNFLYTLPKLSFMKNLCEGYYLSVSFFEKIFVHKAYDNDNILFQNSVKFKSQLLKHLEKNYMEIQFLFDLLEVCFMTLCSCYQTKIKIKCPNRIYFLNFYSRSTRIKMEENSDKNHIILLVS